MSKKILLIAHFYPPVNTVAVHRPRVWAEQLQKEGYQVTVITRKWKGTEQSWDELLAPDTDPQTVVSEQAGIRVIGLAYKPHWLYRLVVKSGKNRWLNYLAQVIGSVFGVVEIDRPINQCYFEQCDALLRKEKFDLIVVSCNPFSGIQLAARLSKKHGVPWMPDLRDMWDMKFQLNDASQVSIKDKLRTYFIDRILFRNLQSAHTIITCNPSYIEILKKRLKNKKYLLVMNGFEAHLFDAIEDQSKANTSFTILCLGTLHLQQEKESFARALCQLIEKYGTDQFHIKFVGVDVNPVVGEQVRQLFPSEVISTTHFVERLQTLKELKNAQVAWYPMWPGYFGLLPVKILEYLGAGKPILITPSDGGLLDGILRETNAGISVSKETEIVEVLERWYLEWLESKTLKYKGDQEVIQTYTREYQTRLLIQYLKTAL